MKKKTANLNIGDKLWLYAAPRILSYEVYGIVSRAEGDYYEIRCNNCNDHSPCEILIGVNDYGCLEYVSMLNEDDDNKQYMWHKTGHYYRKTKKEALNDYYDRQIKYYEEKIDGLKKVLESSEAELEKIKSEKLLSN